MWGINPTGTISSCMKIGLYFLGIWPGVRYQAFLRAFWATSFLTVQTFQYQYIIAYFKYDSLPHLMDVISITLVYSVMSVKLIVLWINDRVFQDLLNTMSNESRMHESEDSNNLIARTAQLSHYLTNRITAIYPMCIIFYALGIFSTQDLPEVKAFEPRKLIITMKLPFKYDVWPVYEITITGQLLFQIMSGMCHTTLTSLLLTLILHVGCQIDILCQELAEITPKNNDRLGRLIKSHQQIITFIGKIEELFTFIALMQFISNTLNICCVGFLIVISIGTENASMMLMKYALFYVIVALDAFVSCFAGEYLSTKSRMIGEAAYRSLWYNLQPDKCQVLLLIILRSQKELTISIGKVSTLSLYSFASILKASISYISVLFAMS